jgi:hypothetical protein
VQQDVAVQGAQAWGADVMVLVGAVVVCQGCQSAAARAVGSGMGIRLGRF